MFHRWPLNTGLTVLTSTTINTFPCCHVCYDFHIKTMFSSSLPPLVCSRVHVLFTLFVFVWVKWYPMHIVLCFSSYCVPCVASFSGFSFFFIAPSVFSDVYFIMFISADNDSQGISRYEKFIWVIKEL